MHAAASTIRSSRHDDLGGRAVVTAHRSLGRRQLPVVAAPLRDIGLREAKDDEIFAAARAANAIVFTKDSDFVRLVDQKGSPPRVLWLTCGNTSDVALQQILARHLSTALALLDGGENLVEIGAP